MSAIVLLVVLGAAGIAIAVASRDASRSIATHAPAVVPANFTQACNGWVTTDPADAFSSTWWHSMAAWMNLQITSGQSTAR